MSKVGILFLCLGTIWSADLHWSLSLRTKSCFSDCKWFQKATSEYLDTVYIDLLNAFASSIIFWNSRHFTIVSKMTPYCRLFWSSYHNVGKCFSRHSGWQIRWRNSFGSFILIVKSLRRYTPFITMKHKLLTIRPVTRTIDINTAQTARTSLQFYAPKTESPSLICID